MAAPKRRHSYYICMWVEEKNPTYTERDERIWNTNYYQLLNRSSHAADFGHDLCGTYSRCCIVPPKDKEAAVHMLGQCNLSRECQGDNPSGPLSAILFSESCWSGSRVI